MAPASGPPQDTSQTKKTISPEQRKLFVGLGVTGALLLVGFGVFSSGILSKGRTPSAVPAPGASDTTIPSTVAAKPPTDPEAAPAAPTTLAATSITPASSAPIARYRRDPFQQVYFIPTPTPSPSPLPVPPPVPIPLPANEGPLSLPGPNSFRSRLQQPLNLLPISINRLDQAVRRPQDAFPPRRSVNSGGGNGETAAASDKRLSGVIIGEGVRAVIEIQRPGGTITRVVQPGDEVDGITVLNIQRINNGTRTITQMRILENGEEKIVELRSGIQQAPPAFGGLPPGFGGPPQGFGAPP